jgi:hypothetical protein
MGSGAGSMSTLSIMRAAILAGSPAARPFAGSSIFRKPCAGVSSFGQGCLHPLKLHRITLPPSRSTAVTGRRQGLFLARVDSRDGLRGKIIWIAATLDLAEAVWWGRSAGSVAVKSRREFASDLKAEGPARAVGAVVGIAASGPLVGRVAELAVLNEAIERPRPARRRSSRSPERAASASRAWPRKGRDRPEREVFAPWGAPRGDSKETFAETLLDGPAPAALRDMLVRRSGGVPFFVRAIILRLIETGALFRSSGRWVLGAGAAAEIPALVSTLLRGKIEVLSPVGRRVLDLVAVCGGVAEHVLLSDVADNLVAGVTELRATGLVAEDTKEGELWYRVVHPVPCRGGVRDAAGHRQAAVARPACPGGRTAPARRRAITRRSCSRRR